jgi:hypothetical protein
MAKARPGYHSKRYWKLKGEDPAKLKKALRKKRLSSVYKITPDQYEQLLQKQECRCAICRRPPKNNRDLSVDHNHVTGEIRGLLCDACNGALGMFRENKDLIRKAIDYLQVYL